jgi:hypothetical protein
MWRWTPRGFAGVESETQDPALYRTPARVRSGKGAKFRIVGVLDHSGNTYD